MTAQPEEDAVILQEASVGKKRFYLCEYENAMPVGSVYQSYMTETDFRKIPKELRAIAMLRCLIVPERREKEAAQILKKYERPSAEKLSEKQKDACVKEREVNGIRSMKKEPDGFTAKLNARKDGYVLFTVPYDDGFCAQVDGEPVEILETNGMMAVPVEKGENEIRFIWRNYDLMAGALCSVAGVTALAFYLQLTRRRERMRLSGKGGNSIRRPV